MRGVQQNVSFRECGDVMIVLSNIHKLYDGTSATSRAIHERVDVWIDEGIIKAVSPHNPTRPQWIRCSPHRLLYLYRDSWAHRLSWACDLMGSGECRTGTNEFAGGSILGRAYLVPHVSPGWDYDTCGMWAEPPVS